MRTAGIIRIVVGLVIALLLSALLIALLAGSDVWTNVGIRSNLIERINEYRAGRAGDGTIVSGEASIPASEINSIRVDWVAGDVELRVGSGDEIVFYETSYRELTSAEKMRYTVTSGGTLEIRYSDELGNLFNWFGTGGNSPTKSLTLEVPASLIGALDKLTVDAVSADVKLTGVYGRNTTVGTVSGALIVSGVVADELSLSSTSGKIVCQETSANTLDLNNVSGAIQAEGEFNVIKADTVSGSVRLSLGSAPESIEGDSVSGSFTISLPESAGFTATLDTVSGSLSCEIPGTLSNNRIVSGDGGATYRFNTVSGSIRIEQN